MKNLRHVVIALAGVGAMVALAGCAVHRADPVPGNAVLATEGNGRLSYRAPNDGVVYILDPRRDRIVYRGAVDEGDLVVVDPDNDRILMDGRVVVEDGIRRGTTHRIFFEQAERERVIEERVVREVVPQRQVEVEGDRIIIERNQNAAPEPERRIIEERRDVIIEERR
jgi:hypothetical protein